MSSGWKIGNGKFFLTMDDTLASVYSNDPKENAK